VFATTTLPWLVSISLDGHCSTNSKNGSQETEMTFRILRRILVPVSLALAASILQAEQKSTESFRVGMAFRSFAPKEPHKWRGAKTHALLTTIWYPAMGSAVEQPLQIPGLTIFTLGNVAQNASVLSTPAKFPLILLSHGTGGTALSLAWFGTALAARGYIVAGVNHPGNNAAEPYTVEGFSTWWERARDLSEVVDALLKDSTFGARIDANRIGAAGFSLGGYTMIEIAGGITDQPPSWISVRHQKPTGFAVAHRSSQPCSRTSKNSRRRSRNFCATQAIPTAIDACVEYLRWRLRWARRFGPRVQQRSRFR
jgi:platelet-activating factor acetylhydrolase isoform II